MSNVGLVSSGSCFFLKVNFLFAELEIRYGQWAHRKEEEGQGEGGTSVVVACKSLYTSECLGKWCWVDGCCRPTICTWKTALLGEGLR